MCDTQLSKTIKRSPLWELPKYSCLHPNYNTTYRTETDVCMIKCRAVKFSLYSVIILYDNHSPLKHIVCLTFPVEYLRLQT